MATNEVVLVDVKNTEDELEAYRMLRDGYKILSNLPESEHNAYAAEQLTYYANLYDECATFLGKLISLREMRKFIVNERGGMV